MADVVAIATTAFFFHDAHIVVKQRAFRQLASLFIGIFQTLFEGRRVDEQTGIEGILESDFAAAVAPVDDALHHIRLKFLCSKAFDVLLEFGERFVKRCFVIFHHAFGKEFFHLEAFDKRLREGAFQKGIDEFDFLLEITIVFQAKDILGEVVGKARDVLKIHGKFLYCKGLKGLKGLKGYKQEVDKSKRWLIDDFVAAGRNDGVVARIPDFAGGFIALPPCPTPLVDAVVEFFQMADERDVWI